MQRSKPIFFLNVQQMSPHRDALTKMKDVYVKNPQMGDPASVDPRLAEIAMNIEKLQSEEQKFEVSSASDVSVGEAFRLAYPRQ